MLVEPVVNEKDHGTTRRAPRHRHAQPSIQSPDPLSAVHAHKRPKECRTRLTGFARSELFLCLHRALDRICREQGHIIRDTRTRARETQLEGAQVLFGQRVQRERGETFASSDKIRSDEFVCRKPRCGSAALAQERARLSEPEPTQAVCAYDRGEDGEGALERF